MYSYLNVVKDHSLFQGIKKEDLSAMLGCLGGHTRSYRKGEILFLSEETVNYVGIILRGSIRMVKENDDGSEAFMAHLKKGELFGETFACCKMNSRVTYRTASACEVLYLPFYKVIHICGRGCAFHQRLVENMVRLLCEKNVQLMEKVEVTSRKTLRDKIMTYLTLQSEKEGRDTFEIPLGRVEFAEYLCADRSALTRELTRMEEDGLISYHKNRFSIKN
ncbi:MAG: Crp/Fnr family transcriptional regulator [Eubacteriales bacterium]|nr:Crp/Fnr family transcriptional regulator [Eubacteriales bacterium]